MNELIENLVRDKVISINPLSDGNFSNWFIVEWKHGKYFMRRFKHNVHGYEYPHDEKWSFDNSNYMMHMFGNEIKSYWVFEFENHLFHVQDYFQGTVLWLDDLNEQLVESIAEYLANLHLEWKRNTNAFNIDKKKRIYARSLREYITNFEGVLPLFEAEIDNQPFFKEFLLKLREQYITILSTTNYERITALHGDFWFGNILYNQENNAIHLVDFSISPFWEPGIDVGWFIADLELWSLFWNYDKLQNYKNLFLNKYISITWDDDIKNYISYMCILKWLKLLSPLVQRFLKRNPTEKKMVEDWIRKLT